MSTMFYLIAFFAFSLKPHKLTLTSKGQSSVRGECQLGNSAVSDGQTYINNSFLLRLHFLNQNTQGQRMLIKPLQNKNGPKKI